jgi:hypothetical protein
MEMYSVTPEIYQNIFEMLGKFFLLKAFLLLTLQFANCSETSNGEFYEMKRSIERSYDQMVYWMNQRSDTLTLKGYVLMEEIFKKNVYIATSLPNLDSLIDCMEWVLHTKLELFIYFWGFFYRLESKSLYIPIDRGETTMVI